MIADGEMAVQRRRLHNRILKSIADEDLELLEPLLVPVALEARSVLHEANTPLEQLYFIESGFVSRIALTDDAGAMEVALAGSDDLIGVGAVLGTRVSLHRSFVVVGGLAQSVSIEDLTSAMGERPAIRQQLLTYVQTLMGRASALALCNSRHSLQERVARWLLVVADQAESHEIDVSHELLSKLLGVRRAGVTVALSNLEAQGIVQGSRGRTRITDIEGLRRSSCGCYRYLGKQSGDEKPPEQLASYHY